MPQKMCIRDSPHVARAEAVGAPLPGLGGELRQGGRPALGAAHVDLVALEGHAGQEMCIRDRFYPVLVGIQSPSWYGTCLLRWLPSWPF